MSALACVTRWLTHGRWEEARREAEQETVDAQQRIVEIERRMRTVNKLRRAIVDDRRKNHYAEDIVAAYHKAKEAG